MTLLFRNLSPSTTPADLTALLGRYGPVTRVDVGYRLATGRPSGSGYVEMESGGPAAVRALGGCVYRGLALSVTMLEPRGDTRPDEPGSHPGKDSRT